MAIYFIRIDGVNTSTGLNNTNNPTSGAWRDLNYACDHTTSGDTIRVTAGTYTETVTCNLPVGVNLVGDGTTSILKSTVTADYAPLLNVSSAVGTNGNQRITNLKFDGQLSTFLPIFIGGRGGVEIDNCTIVDFLDRGVIFSGKGDYTDGAPSTYADGNSFHHNTITNSGRYIHPNGFFGMGNLNIGGQVNMNIFNNTIIQNQRVAGDNGWCIKYANEGHLRNIKIYNNTLVKNKFRGDSNGDGDWDFALELWYCEGGVEIYGNDIQGALDMAYNIKVSPYTYSWWIYDNDIYQPVLNDKFNAGIYIERDADNCIIENNRFDKVAGGISINIEDFPPQTPDNIITNLIIRRNKFTNLGRAIGNGNNGFGIQVSVHNSANALLNGFYIDNNTFVAAPGNAPFEGININLNTIAGTDFKNVFIRNNIVQGFFDYWLRVQSTGIVINGLTVDNNCTYLNAAGATIGFFGGGSVLSYSHNNNINTDPLFVGGNDYTLQSASTLINAGLNIGLPFNGAAPDIGYAEFGGGGGDLTPPTVLSTNPISGATNVPISINPTLTFSEALSPATVNTVSVTIKIGITAVPCTVSYSSNVITIIPVAPLINSTTYTINVSTSVTDVSGNALVVPYTYNFTTASISVSGPTIKRKVIILP